MKLLILYTKNRKEIFDKKSALGSYINYLGNLLNSNEFEVYLNGETIDNSDGNKVKVLPSSKLAFLKKLIPTYVKRLIRESKHLNSLRLFKNELIDSNQKYDIILEYYNMGSDVGMELSKLQNIPYYIFYDGPIIDEYRIFNKSNPFFYDKIIKRQKDSFIHAQKIVAQSNPMKDYICKTITNKKDDIYIHQNVDYTKFSILKDEKIFNTDTIKICFIGSFLKWHQVDLLLFAFKHILDNGIQADLFLLGDGMEKNKMEKRVCDFPNHVKSKIKFTGFVTNQELLEYKKQMDIGVMSGSNWYGAPLKIFEYGAMKMGVIAPNTPTIKDLFPKNEVRFFEWKNQDSLNENLLDFCVNFDSVVENSSVLHKKIMSKYSEENTIKFYLDFLKN